MCSTIALTSTTPRLYMSAAKVHGCISGYRAACGAQTLASSSHADRVIHLCTCWPGRKRCTRA